MVSWIKPDFKNSMIGSFGTTILAISGIGIQKIDGLSQNY
jgi:hypothetical protein